MRLRQAVFLLMTLATVPACKPSEDKSKKKKSDTTAEPASGASGQGSDATTASGVVTLWAPTSVCLGAFISPTVAVTASACFDNDKSEVFADGEGGGRVRFHPKAKDSDVRNRIAVVVFKSPVKAKVLGFSNSRGKRGDAALICSKNFPGTGGDKVNDVRCGQDVIHDTEGGGTLGVVTHKDKEVHPGAGDLGGPLLVGGRVAGINVGFIPDDAPGASGKPQGTTAATYANVFLGSNVDFFVTLAKNGVDVPLGELRTGRIKDPPRGLDDPAEEPKVNCDSLKGEIGIDTDGDYVADQCVPNPGYDEMRWN